MGVIAGLVALLWPGLTVSGLIYVIAAWALLTGIFRKLTAMILRGDVEIGWLMA